LIAGISEQNNSLSQPKNCSVRAMAQVLLFTNFDPETAAALAAAYDEAVARLLDQPDAVRELIARRLVALATRGERNIDKLRDEALIAEGF
jgi:hypothetical protein